MKDLDQIDIEKWFCDKHGAERWTIVYENARTASSQFTLYSCLISPSRRRQSLNTSGWDLMISSSGPGFSEKWQGDRQILNYHRWAGGERLEPIVIVRSFRHGRPDYLEISEELRLLFNLYEDRTTGSFYEPLEDGSELEVIRVSQEKVEIRTTLIRRYLAARQVGLVLQIASDVHCSEGENEQLQELPSERRVKTNAVNLHFYAGQHEPQRPFSVMIGKKFILPPDRSECDLWPFQAPKEYLDFIIDEDERGRAVEHTCNPERLANYFGKNPESPHYLTPVFFRREVLRKYYENPDRYEVSDGQIHCNGIWQLRADNNHADYVAVFLGDLGTDIPLSEQRHWRHYNILPNDRELSETAFRRSFLGEWADAQLSELVFKNAYEVVNESWQKSIGWPLFRELHPEDQHVLLSLRLPLSNSANEFDSQILDLAKLLVDSLNEEQITASRRVSSSKDERGIAKLEGLLREWEYPFANRDADLLRTIQGLRSKGAAHRKGQDYDIAKADLDPSDYHGSFKKLLEKSSKTLMSLAEFANQRHG